MFSKVRKFHVLLLVIICVAPSLSRRLSYLTEKQLSRLKPKKDVDPKNLSDFEKKTNYLYEIIHGRPENRQIESHSCKRMKLLMPDFRAPGRRISEVKCLEHLWKMRFYDEQLIAMVTCGDNFDNTILNANFGGYDAVAAEYPNMGAIGWKTYNDTWLFMCEGALISEKFMVTAAHCTQNTRTDKRISDPNPQIVRFGETNISDMPGIGKDPTDVPIHRIINHPRYDPKTLYYDIAIIELVRELNFSVKAHPSCIWSDFQEVGKGNATLTGWNTIESNDSLSNPVLQVAVVELINSMACEKLLKKQRNNNRRSLLFHQFCAGRANSNNTFQTDIGGVLQAPINIPEYTDWTIHYIIGVRSYGFERNCRNSTISMYTKINTFLDWIESIVWAEKSSTT